MHPLYEKAHKTSADVIGAAIEVQQNFGTGLLESVYAKCLSRELELRGHDVKSEFPVSICYKGFEFKEKLRVDLLVDDALVIEVKARNATRKEVDAFKAQTLSYLKLLDKPLGLLINFNIDMVGKYGTTRIILKGADEERSGESATARSEARATCGTSSERNFADFASNKGNPSDLQVGQATMCRSTEL